MSAPGGVSALGGVCSGGGGGGILACTEADTPPCEQNDRQVQKYYLGHNFIAAGNKCQILHHTQGVTTHKAEVILTMPVPLHCGHLVALVPGSAFAP